MDRPLIARDLVAYLLSSGEHHPCKPELLPLRSLKVVPYGTAVGAEELMTGDLHVHCSAMNLVQPGAVDPDGPDAVDFVPGSFVTEHQKARIGGRKLDVIEPVSAVVERLDL